MNAEDKIPSVSGDHFLPIKVAIGQGMESARNNRRVLNHHSRGTVQITTYNVKTISTNYKIELEGVQVLKLAHSENQ